MDLRDENLDRLNRVSRLGVPDSAIADTINYNKGTNFTEDGIRQIREFDRIGKKEMLLSGDNETAFRELLLEDSSETKPEPESV